jgi:uncharacterized membrane protein
MPQWNAAIPEVRPLSVFNSIELLNRLHGPREELVKRIVNATLWGVLTAFAAANGILAMRYLLPHVPFAAPLPNLKLHRFALALHASCAGVALLVGPFQIAEWFRLRWRQLHRTLGWIYVVAVAVGALSSMVLAPQANYGPIAGFGFFALAVAWLSTTGAALRMVVKHRFKDHRRWMLRSYALTAAAITLRILLPASAVLGLPPGSSYRAVAWMCWLMNLAIVEIYLLFRPDIASHLPRSGTLAA